MKNANAENKKPNSGKIAGLTVLEVLFYILSLPLIVILSAVFCVKTYELVPYYSCGRAVPGVRHRGDVHFSSQEEQAQHTHADGVHHHCGGHAHLFHRSHARRGPARRARTAHLQHPLL